MNVVRNLVQSLTPTGRTVSTPEALADAGFIKAADIEAARAAAETLPIAIPPVLAALIDPDDPDDPIARQFVPDPRETIGTGDELSDPIGDDIHSPVRGIVHRYPDRVLFTPVLVCPVYCRFCFRREAVGGAVLDDAALDAALAYIRTHDEIFEVILSGGDPLILSPRRLKEIMDALETIPHVAIVRIHSRVPVAAPERITDDLISALKKETPVYVVLHCNHPRELTQLAKAAAARLVDSGIPMLSQTVLLKGVNDDPTVMEELMRALLKCRIKPYYLHHGDLARGTSHFRTTLAVGQRIVRALRGRLSGLGQPSYVLDIPGGHGKVPVGPGYLSTRQDGDWQVEDWQGHTHTYRDCTNDTEIR
jgi:lysine 2,3-aminomutase